MSSQITTTAIAMQGGVTAITGTGDDFLVSFGGTWATGDKYTLVLTDGATGFQIQVGTGDVTGIVPTYCFTFANKIYTLAGATTYFTAVSAPTTWNDPNGIGNGFVTMSNWFSTPESLVSMAVYQGRLVFFTRQTTQIWTVNADPDQWLQNQVLSNIGTFAPLSVVSYGDLDVYFLSDTGVRSLRVRDASNNAYVDDIGAAIDELLQTHLATLTETQKATACAIIEPTWNRYMLYVSGADTAAGGVIYTLSYFRSSKISAWTTYKPTWSIGVDNVLLTLTAGSGVQTIVVNGPYVDGGVLQPLTSVIPFHISLVQTASDICDAINLATSVTGYTATWDGISASVVINPPVAVTTLYNVLTHTGAITATVQWSQIPFIPQNMVVLGGQVYMRDGDALYAYGQAGAYDECVMTATLPFLDMKTPVNPKQGLGIDVVAYCTSLCKMTISTALDPVSAIYTEGISLTAAPTVDLPRIPITGGGTHISAKAITSGSGAAVLSEVIISYNDTGEK